MTLQERDYTIFLNDEERVAFELEEKIENRKGVKNNREFPRFSHPDESVREFIWHRRSLFPNNYNWQTTPNEPIRYSFRRCRLAMMIR